MIETIPSDRQSIALSVAGMGVWEWDILNDRLAWDEQLFRIFGVEPGSFTARKGSWASLLHPEDSVEAQETLRRSVESLAEFRATFRIIRKIDGEVRYIGAAGRVIPDESGRAVRMVGVNWDRTEQVKMEKEVARAYDFIESLLNSISDPIFVKDHRHLWVFFNNAFVELIGSQRELILGKTDHDFFPKEMADHFWRVDDQVMKERREIEVEEPVLSRTGETRFLLTKKMPISDPETDEQLLVGVIRDITERRRSEEALRKLQQLVESSNDIIAAFDLDCAVTYSNRAARELYGLAPGERSIHDVVASAKAPDLFGEACERAKAGGHWHGQLELLSAAEGPVPVSASIFGILGKDEKVTSIALVAKDIREQVKSQRLLLEQSKMAALGQLAGGIAHEINNPLAAVRGRLYLLRLALESSNRPPDTKALLEEIQTVDRLTVRISEIVNALKVFSRKDNGSRLAWLSLGDVVREVLSVSAEKLRARNVACEVKVSPNLLVHARRVDLMQILVNLINNSCDAVGEPVGSAPWVKVEARVERGTVLMTVTDSGHGIPDDVAKRMMEPFFTTKEVGQGTGLGLSISRSLAENMGGSLEYDAGAKNTSFVVRLAGRES